MKSELSRRVTQLLVRKGSRDINSHFTGETEILRNLNLQKINATRQILLESETVEERKSRIAKSRSRLNLDFLNKSQPDDGEHQSLLQFNKQLPKNHNNNVTRPHNLDWSLEAKGKKEVNTKVKYIEGKIQKANDTEHEDKVKQYLRDLLNNQKI